MYEEKTVGKRMMEIARRQRLGIEVLSVLIGVGVIIASFFTGDWVMIVCGVIFGVLIVFSGFELAEFIGIRMFGMGVMVDRMAHLKPEYFEDIQKTKTSVFMNSQKTTMLHRPNMETGDVKLWQCPKCGYQNSPTSAECGNCFTPRR